MKREFINMQKDEIVMGYVLETRPHDDASKKSYDDMKGVGYIRVADKFRDISGDDLNDAPFDCNGSIYEGTEIELEKGDMVIVIKKR